MNRIRGRVLAVLFTAGTMFAQSTLIGTIVSADCTPTGAKAEQKVPAVTEDGQQHLGKAETASETTCSIAKDTKAFALQTADGKVIRFDEAGNKKIAKRLRAAKQSAKPSLQVKVKGIVTGGTMTIDSLR